MISAYGNGFILGLCLIIVIGPQNAFVLVQAIRKEHHFLTAGICALLDALLIGVGVLGIGALVASHLFLRAGVGFAGTLFLGFFGYTALRSAFTAQSMELSAATTGRSSLKKTVLAVLGVSLLNPHVYLDTVVMLGAISGSYEGHGRYFFGLGAATASLVWFLSLAQGGVWLAPLFRRPRSWQALNLLICAMVWLVAARLAVETWRELATSGIF